jgi:hypothetical protein
MVREFLTPMFTLCPPEPFGLDLPKGQSGDWDFLFVLGNKNRLLFLFNPNKVYFWQK